MDRILRLTGALMALALLPLPLLAEAPLEQRTDWMAMLLNGSKTGYMRLDRSVYPDRVVNKESLVIQLNRGDSSLIIQMEDESIETPEGRPLGFNSRQRVSGSEMIIRGTVNPDGTVKVVSDSAGSIQEQSFQWQEGAYMAEGLRLLTLEHGLAPGTRFTANAFVPSSLQTYQVEVQVGEAETVDLFGVEARLHRVIQTMMVGQTPTESVAWMDAGHQVKKLTMEVMGLQMEIISCPRECAISESEPTEFFTATFVQAPRGLDRGDLNGVMRYRIAPRDSGDDISFPASDEQQVNRAADGSAYEVTVRTFREPPEASPVELEDGYLSQTRWMQTEASEIQELAQRARGPATEPFEVMLRLQNFVRDFVSDKNLSVGYASALEVAHNRSGDCTEHALLLAALGRAAGIPTRVATGLAYVEEWLGAENVFVPHAWTQAYIDGHWLSFDAALGRFDSGHLALSYGDGDPWHFYEGVNTLGNFRIEAIERIEE